MPATQADHCLSFDEVAVADQQIRSHLQLDYHGREAALVAISHFHSNAFRSVMAKDDGSY